VGAPTTMEEEGVLHPDDLPFSGEAPPDGACRALLDRCREAEGAAEGTGRVEAGVAPQLFLNDLGRLEHLPCSFGAVPAFTAVTELHLGGNCLLDLPEGFGLHLPLLRVLVLGGWVEGSEGSCNQLTSLPDSFAALRSLENLALHDNDLESLEENVFGSMPNLRELRLDCNRRLRALPALPSGLQVLHLENCESLGGTIEAPELLPWSVQAIANHLLDLQLPDGHHIGNFHGLSVAELLARKRSQGGVYSHEEGGMCLPSGLDLRMDDAIQQRVERQLQGEQRAPNADMDEEKLLTAVADMAIENAASQPALPPVGDSHALCTPEEWEARCGTPRTLEEERAAAALRGEALTGNPQIDEMLLEGLQRHVAATSVTSRAAHAPPPPTASNPSPSRPWEKSQTDDLNRHLLQSFQTSVSEAAVASMIGIARRHVGEKGSHSTVPPTRAGQGAVEQDPPDWMDAEEDEDSWGVSGVVVSPSMHGD